MQIKRISQLKNQLGEGPWWNNKTNYLHWTDIIEGKLYSYDTETKHDECTILEVTVFTH